MIDDAELGGLFHRYGFLVHRRCTALLHNRADADDALQEVFLRARRYGATQRSESTLAWLYSIAFSVCCDLMRRRKREELVAPEAMTTLAGRAVGWPDDGDVRAMMAALLRRVDPLTREIAVLHHVSGFTQEEVAEASGYSRRTVGKRLKAFAEQLRRTWSQT